MKKIRYTNLNLSNQKEKQHYPSDGNWNYKDVFQDIGT